jgi:hypothetical protein
MFAFLALQFFRPARPGQRWRAQYSRHVVRIPFTDVIFSSGLKPALRRPGHKHPGSCAHRFQGLLLDQRDISQHHEESGACTSCC